MFCFSVFTFPVILSDCPFSLSVMTAPSLLYHRFHQIHAKFSIFFACIIIIQYIIIRPVSSSRTPIHPRQCLTNCFYILAVLYMKTLNFCCFLTVEIFFFSKGIKKKTSGYTPDIFSYISIFIRHIFYLFNFFYYGINFTCFYYLFPVPGKPEDAAKETAIHRLSHLWMLHKKTESIIRYTFHLPL